LEYRLQAGFLKPWEAGLKNKSLQRSRVGLLIGDCQLPIAD
jgi:hypothetical protein